MLSGSPEFRFGGTVAFSRAKFSRSTVYFDLAKFSGGRVSFNFARFSGGTLDLSSAGDWSFPPEFDWIGAQPSGLKLPKKEDQSQT